MKIALFEIEPWEAETFADLEVDHHDVRYEEAILVFALLLAISHRLIDAADRTRRGDFSQKGLQALDLRCALARSALMDPYAALRRWSSGASNAWSWVKQESRRE